MFNQVIALLGAVAFSTAVFAEPKEVNKKVMCESSKDMLPWFKAEYDEEPMWIGDVDKDTYLALVVNADTRTWSVVMYNKDVACLIETGTGYKHAVPKLSKGSV